MKWRGLCHRGGSDLEFVSCVLLFGYQLSVVSHLIKGIEAAVCVTEKMTVCVTEKMEKYLKIVDRDLINYYK